MRACAVTLHDNRFAAAAAKGARRASPQHWPQRRLIHGRFHRTRPRNSDRSRPRLCIRIQVPVRSRRRRPQDPQQGPEGAQGGSCAARTTRAGSGSCCISRGIDKPMVLNATNKDALVSALGKAPANWINASIGIYVDPNVMFGGVRTGGLRLRVLGPDGDRQEGAGAASASAAKGRHGRRNPVVNSTGPGRCAAAPALLMGSQYATRF